MTELSDQPRVQARLMVIMAKVYSSLGLYDEARPLFQEALVVREEELGTDSAEVAVVLSGLGNLLRTTGNYEEAEGLLRRGLGR